MVLGNFLIDADIHWDRAGKELYEKPEARTGRIMRVQVTNRGVVEDLTGFTLNLGWKSTIDETKFGLDAFDAVDATKGIFELEYTSGMLTNLGTLKGALQLVPTVGNTVESNNFAITVTRSAVDAAGVQTESSFSTLTTALVQVNGWNATIGGKVTAWEADMEATKQTYITTMNDVEAAYPQQIISLGQQLEQIAPYKKIVGETYNSQSLQAFIDAHEYVLIKKAAYLLDAVIKVPSNRLIIVEPGTTITMKTAGNQYIFENADTLNGNENITIIGGEYFGNGGTMTRVYGTTLQNSYYGFGFHFHKVTNLRVSKVKIHNTRGWAIAHMNCNIVNFDDIEVWQEEGYVNGDGITGQSNNVTINNVKGYTNDDLVGVLAYGAQMGAEELHYTLEDTENWTVTNVKPCKHPTGTTYALRGVACYTRGGKTITNLNISDVSGISQSALLKIAGHVSADGFFDNVNISDINGFSVADCTLDISNTNVSTLNIDKMNRVEELYSLAQIYVKENAHVKQMTVSNVNLKWMNGKNGFVVYCKGAIENLIFNNIISLDADNLLGKTLFKNNAVGVPVKTKIKATNIILTPGVAPIILEEGNTISLSFSDLKVNKSILSPNDKDIIFDETMGLVTYDAVLGTWLPVNDKLVNLLYSTNNGSLAITNSYVKVPFDLKRHDTKNTWDAVNYQFTVPETGYYTLSAALGLAQQTVDNVVYLALYRNANKNFILGCANIAAGKVGMVNGSIIVKLVKDEIFDVRVYADSATTIVNNTNSAYISYLNIVKL